MKKINLKKFYPFYNNDYFMEVSVEIAAELHADKRYQETHERTVRREKVYSLDANDGTESSAGIALSIDNPEAIITMMEQHCRLCRALNSLPEIQGRRIDAHYLLNKSVKEIADFEGVSERSVQKSIEKGLANMKRFF